jgi:hypothetical protein
MDTMETEMQASYAGFPGVVIMSIGDRIRFPKFVVKSTTYKFHIDTDEEGYPISGSVTWDGIESIEVASKNTSAYQMR